MNRRVLQETSRNGGELLRNISGTFFGTTLEHFLFPSMITRNISGTPHVPYQELKRNIVVGKKTLLIFMFPPGTRSVAREDISSNLSRCVFFLQTVQNIIWMSYPLLETRCGSWLSTCLFPGRSGSILKLMMWRMNFAKFILQIIRGSRKFPIMNKHVFLVRCYFEQCKKPQQFRMMLVKCVLLLGHSGSSGSSGESKSDQSKFKTCF